MKGRWAPGKAGEVGGGHWWGGAEPGEVGEGWVADLTILGSQRIPKLWALWADAFQNGVFIKKGRAAA